MLALAPSPSFRSLATSVGDVPGLQRLRDRPGPATVVPPRRLDAGLPQDLRHGRDIGPVVQQVRRMSCQPRDLTPDCSARRSSVSARMSAERPPARVRLALSIARNKRRRPPYLFHHHLSGPLLPDNGAPLTVPSLVAQPQALASLAPQLAKFSSPPPSVLRSS